MKFLLMLLVLAVVLFWVFGRQGRRKGPPPAGGKSRSADTSTSQATDAHRAGPAKMLACARCGVHLPSQEALLDDTGRAFCGAEHRLAGPG